MAACRGGVLLVVDDPQGDLPARVGSIATDGVCWYQKLYGGNTAFGWYRMPSQWHSTTQHLESWVARGNTTANSFTVLGLGAPNGLIAGTTLGLPTASGQLHQYGQLRTAAAVGSNALVRAGTIGSGNAAVISGNADETEFEWDLVHVVRTNAVLPGATATDNANVRYWAGAIVGNNVEIAGVGSIADSDVIYTAMASQIIVNAGSYGVMWRFSTGAADAGWAVVTANDNGAVSAQTVTQIAAIALLTEYRLRLRFLKGPRRILASVNDGPETSITLNVGPGTANGGVRFLKPQVIVTSQTAGASKSIGWAKTALFFGGC
jgi:hypothetical protein